MASLTLLTIGQSPRPDLEAELRLTLGDVAIETVGALDGLSDEEVAAHPPMSDADAFHTRLGGERDVIVSKAAVTQLARVAALEWAADGITVNTVHPDGVFDTGLWSDDLIEERAAAYGVTAEEYRTRNLLGREIRSTDVARLVADMCGPSYRVVTGAQVPIDGGSDRVV